ncbi:sulfate transporter [Nematostella vectensis]|uniref:sulfate transporter n=1 Tax=Nematostella vectensis TaxID=45351 RepID=UPI0020777641|nr:sulfate transporter [Nematostella vectensis]
MSDTDFLSTKSQRKVISLSRRAFNENDFKSCYAHSKSARQQTPLWQKGRNHLRRYFQSLTCKSLIYSWFPIVSWLPKYKIKDYLVPDIMGGFTVSILHIPQGLAYALLASVPPIGGLYLAVIPLLVYTIFGTSRHLSLGTFAVVCLMVGSVVEREIARIEPATTQSSILATTSPPISGGFLNTTTLNKLIRKEESNSTYPSDEEIMDKKKMEIAVTLALLVGIVQFLMGLLKLGFVAVYLSDPLISGFTTGAAILVLTSQVKNIFGISVPRYTGAFATVKTYIYMFEHITETVPGSLITGVVCIILVYCLKLLDEKTRKYIKFPIPADLIAVILGTGITYGAETHKKYDVAVLGEIPKGFPPFSTPSLPLMETMIVDAIVIAIVVFATNVSLAKMFAQKNKYTIDPNQWFSVQVSSPGKPGKVFAL